MTTAVHPATRYQFVICRPRTKIPESSGWPEKHPTPEAVDDAIRKYKNIALALGERSGIIDIEIDGPRGEESLRKLFGGEPPETLGCTGRRGARRFFQYDPRFAGLGAKVVSPDYPDLEFRIGAKPAYSLVAPSTTDGFTREWDNGAMAPVALPEAVVQKILALKPAKPDKPKPTGDDLFDELTDRAPVDHAKVWNALGKLKPERADRYDDWLKVGMALHSLGDNYLSMFEAWSAQSAKARGGKQSAADLWANLSPGDVTIGTLLHMAREDSTPAPETNKDDNFFGFVSMKELVEGNYDEQWLIDDMLVAGQPTVIGGPEKVLKTGIIIEAAVALASQTPMLGRFAVLKRCVTLVMTAESGMKAIEGTVQRICAAKGVNPRGLDVHLSGRLPQLDNDTELEHLENAIRKYGAEVVFVDPAYLCLGGSDHGDVFNMGPLLRGIGDVCGKAGATIAMAHHATKALSKPSMSPISLTDLSQAGFREWAGTWWLLNRRSEYQVGKTHELWLRAGSRSGDTYDFMLDIFEGSRRDPGGKIWRVDRVQERSAALAEEKLEDEKTQFVDERERILDYLTSNPDGKALGPIVKTTLVSRTRAVAILNHLVSDGLVVECEVPHPQSQKKTIPGYRLSSAI